MTTSLLLLAFGCITPAERAEKLASLEAHDSSVPDDTDADTDTDTGAPALSVDPGGSDPHAMSFTSTLGSPDVQSVTVSNEGTAPLVITRVTVSNSAGCGTFTVAGPRATTLDGGTSTTFDVTYAGSGTCVDTPDEVNDENLVHLDSNDPVEPAYRIRVSGTSIGT